MWNGSSRRTRKWTIDTTRAPAQSALMLRRSGLVTSIALAVAVGCGSPNYVIVHNPVASVRVSPALDTIPFGGTVALQVATFDLNGPPTIPDHHPVWTSLNTAIFDVDSVG